MPQSFQVDLAGIVDLLARHLYSSPRVYVRELLQNGVDAITARQSMDADAPAQIWISFTDDGSVVVRDTGIGLTAGEAEDLLATIGRSSKRDVELGTGREEFLGQFGIGLLSAFMVAAEIDMTSLSAIPGSTPIRWRGYADGTYELLECPPELQPEPGSTVRLAPRRDLDHWLEHDTVIALAREYGSLLPVDVRVETAITDPVDGSVSRSWIRISQRGLPWLEQFNSAEERRQAMREYCRTTLGFTPLAAIDLTVPLLDTTGVAFIVPSAVAPTATSAHQVYLKRMLLGSRVADVLPDWAFFVRCVVNTSTLRPTASREALYDDDRLLAAREALGNQVLAWMTSTLADLDDPVAQEFVKVHHLAIRAAAIHDAAMLEMATKVVPFETTDGPLPVAAFQERFGAVRYTPTVEEFRRIAPVAMAQGLGVLNGGYVYDAELLDRIAARFPHWDIRPLAAADVDRTLSLIPELDERRIAATVARLDDVLEPVECQVAVRVFEPATLPALLVHDRDSDHQRDLRRTVADADDLWADVLSSFQANVRPRQLMLNYRNQLVRQLFDTTRPELQGAGVEALYITALLLAQEPLRGSDAEMMNRSMTTLLGQALGSEDDSR